MRKLGLVLAAIFFLSSCSLNTVATKDQTVIEKKITKHPAAADFQRGKLSYLPAYNPDSDDYWQVDLRGYDLSSLNLEDRLYDLQYADFDTKTIWPDKLPKEFNPDKIMEIGKSPGLNIDKLHKEGITGKGIAIAIIDQALLVDHSEYKDNLKLYEEIHWPGGEAQMHGPAVASIAVGKTVGVAPDADLYYIAEQHGEFKGDNIDWDFTWLAKSINRILKINKTLPKDRKIRVISISVGWEKNQKGYSEVTTAVEEAKKQGIFVVSSSLYETYGYFFHGLGRNPMSDPNEISSYEPGLFWAKRFYNSEFDKKKKELKIDEILLMPMDSRTTASPTGNNDYVFYREGGWSWSIPYIAGLYALACQVKPDINPDIFWKEALRTGKTITLERNGNKYELGKIVSPVDLIYSLKNN